MSSIVGSTVPEFRAPTSRGQTLDRASFIGKVGLALCFVGEPTAEPAAGAISRLDAELVEFGHRRIQLLLVAAASAREVRELADGRGYTVPLLADPAGDIANAFEVSPAADALAWFVVDIVGTVVDAGSEEPSAVGARLLRAVDEVGVAQHEPSFGDLTGVARDATTLLDAIHGLEAFGYHGQFIARHGGQIECVVCKHESAPERVRCDLIYRLEGASDPSDMLAVCALRCPRCGTHGTLVLNYGPEAGEEDDEALRRLEQPDPVG
jgi:peroxiredoxin